MNTHEMFPHWSHPSDCSWNLVHVTFPVIPGDGRWGLWEGTSKHAKGDTEPHCTTSNKGDWKTVGAAGLMAGCGPFVMVGGGPRVSQLIDEKCSQSASSFLVQTSLHSGRMLWLVNFCKRLAKAKASLRGLPNIICSGDNSQSLSGVLRSCIIARRKRSESELPDGSVFDRSRSFSVLTATFRPCRWIVGCTLMKSDVLRPTASKRIQLRVTRIQDRHRSKFPGVLKSRMTAGRGAWDGVFLTQSRQLSRMRLGVQNERW